MPKPKRIRFAVGAAFRSAVCPETPNHCTPSPTPDFHIRAFDRVSCFITISTFRFLHFRITGPLRPENIASLTVEQSSGPEPVYTLVADSTHVTQRGRASIIEFEVSALDGAGNCLAGNGVRPGGRAQAQTDCELRHHQALGIQNTTGNKSSLDSLRGQTPG